MTAKELIEYCKSENRVCPRPMLWNDLYNILLKYHKDDKPPIPLILAAWWEAPNLFKQLRLVDQIDWANSNNCFNEVENFILNLLETNWHHFND